MDADQPYDLLEPLSLEDSRSTPELIQVALTTAFPMTDYDDEGWHAIHVLKKRGTREIFDAARALCERDDLQGQNVGANILGELGFDQGYPFRAESLPILFRLLANQTDVEVLSTTCWALGHLGDPSAVEPLVKLKNHPHGDVRQAIVRGLWTHDDPLAVQALIELSTDEDEVIRDWATFGLGSQIDLDTPAIREALYARLGDSHSNTSGEAVIGLARRKDERMIQPLIDFLMMGDVGNMLLRAAEEMADLRLLPALLHLKGMPDYHHSTDLDRAIAACGGDVDSPSP